MYEYISEDFQFHNTTQRLNAKVYYSYSLYKDEDKLWCGKNYDDYYDAE